jgi:hypothetical protein
VVPTTLNTQATIEELSFIYNGAVNTPVTIEKLLGIGVFCWVYPRLYNEDSMSAEIELRKSLEMTVEYD